MKYLQRIADNLLEKKMEVFGAVLIEGPKWCGKTTTAEQHAASVLKLQDPNKRDGYLTTARIKPSLLLEGDSPRLIDEWQEAPVLWDAVRMAVDENADKGLFILTGSNSIPIRKGENQQIRHTGTGRITRLKMNTMSLWESGDTTATISLKELFDHPETEIDGIKSELTIEDLIFLSCRGGWPASTGIKDNPDCLMIAEDYVDSVCETDTSTIDNVRRNPLLIRKILRSYARNNCTLATKQTLMRDVRTEFESLSAPTFDDYLNALERLFVIDELQAWCPAIRSATAIRSGHKRCFSDPSMAVASLGLRPEHFHTDLKTFGFIFENLCIRDLRAYSTPMNGRLSYYHDRYGLEADAVLHLPDGRYALMEFKLGSAEIEEGARHLLEIQNLIIKHNNVEKQVPFRLPDLMIVITGGEMAYRRPDGVLVIPIGCIKN